MGQPRSHQCQHGQGASGVGRGEKEVWERLKFASSPPIWYRFNLMSDGSFHSKDFYKQSKPGKICMLMRAEVQVTETGEGDREAITTLGGTSNH